MGESILGLPNRFKIINNLLESTYNPNHMLSAYQGHRIANDYLNRSGGLDYAMTGELYSRGIRPINSVSYDIGTKYLWFNNLYVSRVVTDAVEGNASSATKLVESRKIELTGSVTGSIKTDFSGDVIINTATNHNHDTLYVKKVGNSPLDPITGPLYARSIVPTTDAMYALGTSSKRYSSIFTKDLIATNISGSLNGNASTSTKLANTRNITVRLTPSTVTTNNYGIASFDGSSNITIDVQAPYLPINGGTLYGNLSLLSGNITPYSNKIQNIGDSDHRWNYIYGDQVYGSSFYGNLYGDVFGNAGTSTKLKNARTIKVVLANSDNVSSNYGSASFDGSSDTTISVWAPYLPINGGTISGNVLPKLTNTYTIGSDTNKFSSVYANSFVGNADTSTKLQTARTITVGNTSRTFDGSSNVSWSLSDIGAADANVGDTIWGTDYKGIYIIGTRTGYLESGIYIPPGIWLLDANIRHCCGNIRMLVSVSSTDGSTLATLSSINPGECKDRYFSNYRCSAIYNNNTNDYVFAYIVIDTLNIDDSLYGKTYDVDETVAADWRPSFRLVASRLK